MSVHFKVHHEAMQRVDNRIKSSRCHFEPLHFFLILIISIRNVRRNISGKLSNLIEN